MNPRPLPAVLLKITAYYLITGCILAIILARAPWVLKYLPVGAAEQLFSSPAGLATPGSAAPLLPSPGEGPATGIKIVYLLLVFLASILVSLPLAVVYRSTARRKKGPSPATIRMILLLPICVAGLVLIVQNSLALAFGLAGLIAGAGVRFRTNVKDVSETLYFMIATGIGMASGVGAIGIALVMSMIFCYATLIIRSRESDPIAAAGTAAKPPAGED
jgi:hypothetical protein